MRKLSARGSSSFTAAAEGTPRERGAAVATLADEIVRASAEEQRAVIVTDGIKALRDYAEGYGFGFRGVAYDLASKVAHSKAVLVFVGEYTTEEVAYAPEFAVADGIIYLADEPFGRFDKRWLRVLKLRGTNFVMGKHSFRISLAGIDVFPRSLARRPRASGFRPESAESTR